MNKSPAQWNFTPLKGVQRVVTVASAKGGVGKSTTSVMLACALQKLGKKVGLLDADIYGPSLPRMLGLHEKPEVENRTMQPLDAEGIAVNSMGFLMDDDAALVWRGPMITKALYQLARTTRWDYDGELDILLIDMPPGTGDVHLSMVQQVPVDGAVIVTTPQKIATQEAVKCLDMFLKVKVPALGVIENMSWLDTDTGHKQHPFGKGGGKALAESKAIPLLGEIPLIAAIGSTLDEGLTPDPAWVSLYEGAAQTLLHGLA